MDAYQAIQVKGGSWAVVEVETLTWAAGPGLHEWQAVEEADYLNLAVCDSVSS